MTLSNMTADEVVFALRATGHVDERRERATRAISVLACIPRGRQNDDARDLLDDWFQRGDRDKLNDAAERTGILGAPVHRPTAEAAAATGIMLRALALCSDACAGVASVDIGSTMLDHRQVSALPEGNGYRFMVPLTADLYTDGWRMLVRGGAIPDTVATALVGREAAAVADHPLLSGRLIAGTGDDQGTFRVLDLDPPVLERWRDFG